MGGALLGVGRSAPPPNNACCDDRRACDAFATHTQTARAHATSRIHPRRMHTHKRALPQSRARTRRCAGVQSTVLDRSASALALNHHKCEIIVAGTDGTVRTLRIPPCHSPRATEVYTEVMARSVSAQMSRVPARLLWRADVVVSPGADLAGLPRVTTATSAPGLELPLSHQLRDWAADCDPCGR